MAPKFLNDYVSPFLHAKALDLINPFEVKSNLANGRPFSFREDFNRAVLDVMLHHTFGEDYSESALKPQLELLDQMTPSSIAEGRIDERVEFSEELRSFFLELLHETAEVLERTTVSSTPRLSFWWWSKQAWYKRMVRERNRILMEHLRKAADNLHAGKVRAALDHMVMREQVAAEKHRRAPQLFS